MCTHDFDSGMVLVQVDTDHEHGRVSRWRGHDDSPHAPPQAG